MKNVVLTILEAKYDNVRALGNGLYLVYSADRFGWWGIYSCKSKSIVCSGDKHEVLSSDLIAFERLITWTGGGSRIKEFLFSLQKKREVRFGEYRGSTFELCGKDWIKALFLKTVEKENGFDVVGGLGVFDTLREKFIIQPKYEELISLGDNQYYGTKEDRRTGQRTYFLISIDEEGKVTTRKTSKIV